MPTDNLSAVDAARLLIELAKKAAADAEAPTLETSAAYYDYRRAAVTHGSVLAQALLAATERVQELERERDEYKLRYEISRDLIESLTAPTGVHRHFEPIPPAS